MTKTAPDGPRPPRMLVTGATGLLGASFCAAAAGTHEVTAVAMHHALRLDGVSSVRADLRDGPSVERLLESARPAVIVHMAAATDVNRCETHPEEAQALNVGATASLARWAARTGSRILHLSTDSVFDGRQGRYTEADEPHPLNRYAASKLRCEEIVRQSVPDHLIVRASFYGWNAQAKSSLGEWILDRLERGVRVPGFTDAVFTPLLANTLGETLLALLGRGLRGTYHAASRDSLSKHDFAVAVAEAFALPAGLVDRASLAGSQSAALRPLNTSLDAGKLEAHTGLRMPLVREDLARFRQLREDGFARRLREACIPFPP